LSSAIRLATARNQPLKTSRIVVPIAAGDRVTPTLRGASILSVLLCAVTDLADHDNRLSVPLSPGNIA